jgi:hypothetical protein
MPTYFDGKLVFIHIPKCAGSSVLRALKGYHDAWRSNVSGEPTWYRMHESLFEIQTPFIQKWGAEKWEQAVLISTIRHPIDRAVSWWKFRKRKNMRNFLNHENVRLESLGFDAVASFHPYITPEDYAMYHKKVCECHHETDRAHVEEFDALPFHDFIGRMTTWKKSGCSYPNCPYHALVPQTCWLHDVNGDIQMDKLNLFLVDSLGELGQLLPEMGEIGHENVSKGRDEDYREHLTTESLLLLNKFYAEDFKLYETLKRMPRPHYSTPLFTHNNLKED